MDGAQAYDQLVNGYDLDEELAEDILAAAHHRKVLELRVVYTTTVDLIVRSTGPGQFVVDETDA